MSSTFFGLEIGRSALLSHQKALDVTGHNIANANTAGFSRQEAVLTATTPFTVPGYNRPIGPGQVGTGVQVAEIRRLRDNFLDVQIRTENKNLGLWEAKRDVLQKVEVILNEPSDASLRNVLDQFWQSWQELSKTPESLSVRSVVRQRGLMVAETFNHIDLQYRELQRDLNDNIKVTVQDVNSIASQIAQLNEQILPIEAQGDKANDLRDQRDLLVDKLSKIVNISVNENQLGQVTVGIGGRSLVMGNKVVALKAQENAANHGYVDVVWAEDNQLTTFSAGELQGLLEARGYTDWSTGEFIGIIPSLRADLDSMAKTIVEETNKVHRGGYDLTGNQNNNFFKPFVDGVYPPAGISLAQAMQLDDAIIGSLNTIASGKTPPEPGAPPKPITGDGSNALEIAELKHLQLMDLSKGQSNLVSSWVTKQSYATQGNGIDIVPYTAGTNLLDLGAGGLFKLTDFGPNASLTFSQGDKNFSISLTDALGGDALTPAGIISVNDLLTKINTEAVAQGMDLNASLVEEPPLSGEFILQVKSGSAGLDKVITVEETNFLGAASFGWANANTTGTVDDYYRALLGKLGVDSQEASRMTDNGQLLVDQLDNRRKAVAGVSLDEEMTNMVRFQHGYNAAARVITVMDEMLDKIINGMGMTR